MWLNFFLEMVALLTKLDDTFDTDVIGFTDVAISKAVVSDHHVLDPRSGDLR